MKQFGIILLIAGIIIGIYALSMDTSVEVDYHGFSYGMPERVNNIGLMNTQRNLVIVSGILSIIGLIMALNAKSIATNENEKSDLETLKKQKETLENVSNIADDLKKIKELLDSGVINQEEFDKMKNRLMDSMDNSSILAMNNDESKSKDIDDNGNYSAPKIKSETKTNAISLFSNYEKIDIEFIDGINGKIYHKPSKKEFYFKQKGFSHYYDNYSNCVNALHYFLTKDILLKTGFNGTYS
jgi:hypothetical protein